MKKIVFSTSCLLFIMLISCDKNKTAQANNEAHEHWSYEGETSPEHWAEIEKDSDCSGNFQSPVNIATSEAIKDTILKNKVDILYSPETELSQVKNNGHSIEFDFDEGDSIRYMNDIYHLKQIHFHEPAEHTINGVRFPLEMHLVHMDSKNQFTVISILGEQGFETEYSEFLNLFLPLKEGVTKEIHESFDLTDLFQDNTAYYSYKGSLTTPPCTEQVNWIILKESITISEEAVNFLKNNMPLDNYRNEQPLNGRKVYSVSLND